MIHRIFLFAIISAVTGMVSSSCSENISDCPSRMCIIAGGWQLTEVLIDDASFEGDLHQYKLTLTMPSPADAASSAFTRTQSSGATDAGTWSLENNESILRLVPDDNPLLTEDWIIEKMTPREMVLVIVRDTGIKGGPGKIQFTLEPI